MVAIRPYQPQGKNNPFDLDDDHEIRNMKDCNKDLMCDGAKYALVHIFADDL